MINGWCPMNRALTSAPVTAELLLLLVDLEINHKFRSPLESRTMANMFRVNRECCNSQEKQLGWILLPNHANQ